MLNAALEAAMTTVPRLLMADWMTMFETANTALWMPAGRPMLRMRFKLAPSMRRCLGSMRMHFSVRSRRRKSRRALMAFDTTVAMATPLTVMPSTATKKRFSSTFRMPETASAASGTFVSPTLRKIAASKL